MDQLDFSDLKGFEWDKANEHKNAIKHNVSKMECEQIFFNDPILLFADEKRYFILGQTNDNRELFVVFTVRKNLIRVISARNMNRKERKIYENQKITYI